MKTIRLVSLVMAVLVSAAAVDASAVKAKIVKKVPIVKLVSASVQTERVLALSDGCVQTEFELISCAGGYWFGKELGNLRGKTVKMFAGSYGHLCALTTDGTVGCVGDNEYGQLGDGSTKDSNTFVDPKIPSSIVAVGIRKIQVDDKHSCVITNSNDLVCWGLADWRIFQTSGLPMFPAVIKSEPIKDLSIVDIEFDDYQTCVAALGRTIRCANKYSNADVNSFWTVDASSINTSDEISVLKGVGGSPGQMCILTKNGEVHCQENYNGRKQSGTFSYSTKSGYSTPNIKLGKIDLSDIATGLEGEYNRDYGKRICALLRSGDLECWGGGFAREVQLGVVGLPNVVVKVARSTSFSTTAQFSVNARPVCNDVPWIIQALSPEGSLIAGPTQKACEFDRNNPISAQQVVDSGNRWLAVSDQSVVPKAIFKRYGKDICLSALANGELAFGGDYGPMYGSNTVIREQFFGLSATGTFRTVKSACMSPGQTIFAKIMVRAELVSAWQSYSMLQPGSAYEIYSIHLDK